LDTDIRMYFLPKRAYIERKIIHRCLTTNGVTDLTFPKQCSMKHQYDLSQIPLEKQIFVTSCVKGPHWHYEQQAYYLTAEQLNSSGAYKKTLLPTSTYAKCKLIIRFPEGIIHHILYSVTVQGVEITSGKITMDYILSQLEENRDLNLDPLILKTIPFMTLIYNITHIS